MNETLTLHLETFRSRCLHGRLALGARRTLDVFVQTTLSVPALPHAQGYRAIIRTADSNGFGSHAIDTSRYYIHLLSFHSTRLRRDWSIRFAARLTPWRDSNGSAAKYAIVVCPGAHWNVAQEFHTYTRSLRSPRYHSRSETRTAATRYVALLHEVNARNLTVPRDIDDRHSTWLTSHYESR